MFSEHDHAAGNTNTVGRHDFISDGVLEHAVLMDSRFVGERVRTEWTQRHRQPPTERDVERIFEDFIPKQAEVLVEYSAPIPGVPETVEAWRSGGLRIGSTTGYTRALLDVVIAPAAKLGYAPDASVTPD